MYREMNRIEKYIECVNQVHKDKQLMLTFICDYKL